MMDESILMIPWLMSWTTWWHMCLDWGVHIRMKDHKGSVCANEKCQSRAEFMVCNKLLISTAWRKCIP